MRRLVAVLLIVLGIGGILATQSTGTASAQNRHAALAKIDGTIQPTSASFLSRVIDDATDDEAEVLILEIDTPGGLLSSTRKMVKEMLAAEIPIVAYVSPPGARAASAGTFIVAATHIAAMAPVTNIGAASPVGAGGEELPETIKSKATQDVAALMRNIAEERGRNVDALEQTVLSAASYTMSQALEMNVIDLIADDINDLLSQIDGMTVLLPSGEVTLNTADIEVETINPNALERFLEAIADPNIAFLLLTFGGLLIFVEFLNPGMIVPGLFGVIMLVLAFLGLGQLPVNWVGVGLIIFAMVLFFLEFQAPGLGIFGLAGAITFVLGAFLLVGSYGTPPIDAPNFRVSIWLIGGVSAAMFAALVVMLRVVLQSKRVHYVSEGSRLVGQTGITKSVLNPHGTVQVASELWSADSDNGEPIAEGEDVVVLDVEGLILKVFKVAE